jgi:hypothetical protein
MPKQAFRETDMYPPIKAMLEAQGYTVKGEVGAADIVAVRDGEDPVIVEMKSGFSLGLFHQACERLAITEAVYVAVPHGTSRASFNRNRKLCRRLGLGLITVRTSDGFVEVPLDPGPYAPRKAPRRKTRLLREFARLEGDPNPGGSTRRNGLMTAYRQDALRCLRVLVEDGPTKAAVVARRTGVTGARRLMADNHYGWFERVETGIYAPSPNGVRASDQFGTDIARLCCTNKAGS